MGKSNLVEARVRLILSDFPEARDDDFWLIVRYYQKFHPELKLYVEYSKIRNAVAPETLRRRRQHIQNDCNELLPTNPEVLRMRAEASNKTGLLLRKQEADLFGKRPQTEHFVHDMP